MPRRAAAITQADLDRALKAASNAGLKVARFELDGSKVIVFAGDPAAPPINDLDIELRQFEARRGQG